MSRLGSPEPPCVCMPTSSAPSGRWSAAHAIGSIVATVTSSAPYSPVVRTAAVAAGTTSRIATQSPSCARPENGRLTTAMSEMAAPRPWHSL